MGCLKRRIYPRDITINIGPGEPVPAHPYPGQAWKEVRHDRTVTWLAYWKDPVNEKEYNSLRAERQDDDWLEFDEGDDSYRCVGVAGLRRGVSHLAV